MAWVIYWVGISVTAGACVFALVKGNKPERYGAILRLLVGFIGAGLAWALALLGVPAAERVPITDLAATGIASFGFLFIALRYGSSWLALAMVIQGLQFYVDRVFLDNDAHGRASFSIQENLITTGVGVALVFATIASIRKRMRERQAAELRRQKDEARLARIEAMLSDQGRIAA